MRTLYTLLLYLLLPVVLLRLYMRGRKAPAYRRRISERFVWRTDSGKSQPSIWVHAVSVGEVLGSAPLIRKLLDNFPRHRIIVTTTTPTGSERVQKLFGEQVTHCYAPYDLPGPVKRFLNFYLPDILVLFETEIWPNTIHHCHKRNIPVVLANGRMSERSAKGYAKLAAFTRTTMKELTMIAAQSNADAERFIHLGGNKRNIQVTGSIKFDLSLSESLRENAKELRKQWQARPSLIAASTHEGEDEQVLEAFAKIKQAFPEALLILVPRHPERFNEVASLIVRHKFSVVRRSEGTSVDARCDVLLADTMGELLLLYGCVDVAFVAGSLVPRGGHNLLEPAAWGIPVLSGPHLFNFQSISEMFREGGALEVVKDSNALAISVIRLFSDRELSGQMGKRAEQIIVENRGALHKQYQLIKAQIRRFGQGHV